MQAPQIPDKLFFRIGDAAELLGVKPYVIRYWESEFAFLSPEKSNTGQRVYKRSDVETLLLIKHLLYNERYSIEGARKRIRELRREGEFENLKRDKVLGGELYLENQERLKELKKVVGELREFVKTPLHELFKH